MHTAPISPLESRRLLSAQFTLDPAGTLFVDATSADETITVGLSGGSLVVQVNQQLQLFDPNQVARIRIDAAAGHDTITNNTAIPATLLGGAGNDTLTGGFGVDRLSGGAGANLVSTQSSTLSLDYETNARPGLINFYSLELSETTGTLFAADPNNVAIEDRFLSAPDHLVIWLGDAHDKFNGDAGIFAAQAITIHGRGGDDQFADFQTFVSNPGPAIAFIGGPGNDRFVVQGRVDTILGGDGDDYIDDRTFLPTLTDFFVDLGEGYDIHDASAEVFSGDGTAIFRAFAGVEELRGPDSGTGNYTLMGNELDNRLTGTGSEAITILGMGGNDRLFTDGGAPHALLDGGDGDDLLDASGNGFFEPAGANALFTIRSGTELPSATLVGGQGNDLLIGGEGNDRLEGNAGRDRLEGGDGDDSLFGGPGGDLLLGGFGNDFYDGGPGRNYILDPDTFASGNSFFDRSRSESLRAKEIVDEVRMIV